MKILILRFFIFFALGAQSTFATTWAWMSTEQYIETASLIAVIHIEKVHTASTPEGIYIQSAFATIEDNLYQNFTISGTIPEKIVIYAIDPNAIFDDGSVSPLNAHWHLKEGRFFTILQIRGHLKFVPFDRLSIQTIENNSVYWPTKESETEQTDISIISDSIDSALKRKNAG